MDVNLAFKRACIDNNESTFFRLIDHPDVDVFADDFFVLMYSKIMGHSIIYHNASVWCPNTFNSDNTVGWACRNGHVNLVKRLLEDGADPNMFDGNGFKHACRNGHSEIVSLLLNHPDIDLNCTTNGWNGLTSACYQGHIEIVHILLSDMRIDPSVMNNMAIRNACKGGHYEIVRVLLKDKRVDPSDCSNDALLNAIYSGYPTVVDLLLDDSRVSLTEQAFSHTRHPEVANVLMKKYNTLTEKINILTSLGLPEAIVHYNILSPLEFKIFKLLNTLC
jgi:ankyrin repeat protein